MFVDPTLKILDPDQSEIMVEQSSDLDPDGKVVIVDGKPRMKGGKPMTFGYVAVSMLLAQFDGEEKLPGPKKMDRMELAEKLHGAVMPVEITNDHAQLILDLAAKGLTILTYGRVKQIVTAAEAASIAKPVANGAAHQELRQ